MEHLDNIAEVFEAFFGVSNDEYLFFGFVITPIDMLQFFLSFSQ